MCFSWKTAIDAAPPCPSCRHRHQWDRHLAGLTGWTRCYSPATPDLVGRASCRRQRESCPTRAQILDSAFRPNDGLFASSGVGSLIQHHCARSPRLWFDSTNKNCKDLCRLVAVSFYQMHARGIIIDRVARFEDVSGAFHHDLHFALQNIDEFLPVM